MRFKKATFETPVSVISSLTAMNISFRPIIMGSFAKPLLALVMFSSFSLSLPPCESVSPVLLEDASEVRPVF